MSEPTTEAGGELHFYIVGLTAGLPQQVEVLQAADQLIVAIEAEAYAAEEARWRRLPGTYRREDGHTEVVVDVPESLSWLQDELRAAVEMVEAMWDRRPEIARLRRIEEAARESLAAGDPPAGWSHRKRADARLRAALEDGPL